jgi:hypothetical protein
VSWQTGGEKNVSAYMSNDEAAAKGATIPMAWTFHRHRPGKITTINPDEYESDNQQVASWNT